MMSDQLDLPDGFAPSDKPESMSDANLTKYFEIWIMFAGYMSQDADRGAKVLNPEKPLVLLSAIFSILVVNLVNLPRN